MSIYIIMEFFFLKMLFALKMLFPMLDLSQIHSFLFSSQFLPKKTQYILNG